MLNIGIDMERMRNVNSGLGQYCLQLANALQDLAEIKAHFYYPTRYELPRGQNAYNISSNAKITGISAPQINLFHATHQDSKLRARNKPMVLTIHDLNFIEKYGVNSVRYHQFLLMIQRRINRSLGVNFISNYTFNIAQQHLNFDKVKTKVIYNGFCLSAKTPIKPGVAPACFLFAIGIVNPKKNFHTLLPIVKATGLPLIIAGNNTHVYAASIKQKAIEMGIGELVHLVGLINEAEKLWYYQNCEGFLFPSLAEGFGMPVIEAMSVGKPVFISKKTSLPEVGGPQAFFFDNFEGQHMIDVFEKGMRHYNNTPSHKDAIMKHAHQYSWENSAKEYLSFYKSVL
jgi:glycosyltransferase involved in cell wall biosynthesis